MATMPTDLAEIFRADHRHGRIRMKRHPKHGRKPPSPVRKWKKEHYGHRNPDSGVGSNSSSQSDGKTDISETETEKSSTVADESDGNVETGSGDSSSCTDIADLDSTPNPDAHNDRNNNNNIGLTAHQTLSLEDTLRRQQTRDKSIDTHELFTDARYHLARAGKHILDWVLLIPTDLTLSFSKGFHNAPKLYHDPMVQETPTVRGVKGGLRAAGTVSLTTYWGRKHC